MFETFHYKHPYKQYIQLKQGRFFNREGLILRKIANANNPHKFNYGEISPFPGLQSESLADCIKQLKQPSHSAPPSPSVAWGLHQLDNPLNPPTGKKLPLNALLKGQNTVDFMKNAEERYQEGYRCFKIKVGLQSVDKDIERVQSLINNYPDLQLRLDANKSWSFKNFLNFSNLISPANIDYFEEPFKNNSDYQALTLQQWKTIALDESLTLKKPAFSTYNAKAYVLKPMVLGPQRFFKLLTQAKAKGITPVISSCFESSWGLSYLAQIALANAPNIPCGLDTWRYFTEDICEPRLHAEKACIDFDHVFFTAIREFWLKWNTSYLRKIN